MRTDTLKALYSILSTTAGVTTLAGTKIYPRRAAQEAGLPYVVMSIISSEPTDTKDRTSHLDMVRVQIDCYATTYRVAEQLHDAVRTAIDGYEIGATVNGVLLDGISYVTENDAFDDDIHVFRKSADYMVRVKY